MKYRLLSLFPSNDTLSIVCFLEDAVHIEAMFLSHGVNQPKENKFPRELSNKKKYPLGKFPQFRKFEEEKLC